MFTCFLFSISRLPNCFHVVVCFLGRVYVRIRAKLGGCSSLQLMRMLFFAYSLLIAIEVIKVFQQLYLAPFKDNISRPFPE